MNSRKRFLATMAFEPLDRGLLWEMGYMADAVRRWYAEGLPGKNEIPDDVGSTESVVGPGGQFVVRSGFKEVSSYVINHDISRHLGFDKGTMWRVPVRLWVWPPFETKVIEDRGETVVEQNTSGGVYEQSKGKKGLPRMLRGPVQNRDDWERVKAERFQPDFEARIPADWGEFVRSVRERDYPLIIGGIPSGMHSSLLHLFGEVQYFYALYDQRDLMEEILDYLVDFWIELYGKALEQVDVDAAFVFEDMCFRSGPLISPALFRDMMLPRYKRLTGFLRSCGVKYIILDSDGDCRQLIPLFLEGGVTCLWPLENTPGPPGNGQSVIEVRQQFPDLCIWGGIDKKALARGKAAIDAELELKVPFMMKTGGYIACVDHVVPSDVSWENFCYYRERLAQLLDCSPR